MNDINIDNQSESTWLSKLQCALIINRTISCVGVDAKIVILMDIFIVIIVGVTGLFANTNNFSA